MYAVLIWIRLIIFALFYENHYIKHDNCTRRTIFQSTLGGSPQTVVTSVSSNIGKIAYDWLTDNLYWTDTSFNRILMAPVSNPDLVKTVVLLDTDRPTSLAISPADG